MSSAPVDRLVGHTFEGRYVIRSRIARGGMAMVYLANDLRLERRVAIKVMHAHLADDENFTRRFAQEARSAAGLAHPNVVSVFDQGDEGGVPYLVMEYLPGITLRELLKQQQRLTAEESLEIGEAVLAGLAAAHRSGIVHRDLKPENVLLADDGRIKIGDFGLARSVSANTTTGQALLGTIAYLSPELVTRGVADARSDLYAFGIMLFEMLTGSQPFRGEQPMQIAYQHAHSEVPPPSTLTHEATPELDELVRWTTQRDPDSRPGDASEALDHLRRMRSGSPGATRVLPRDERPPPASTPSTTVLSELQRAELAGEWEEPVDQPDEPDAAGTRRAQALAARRRSRGRLIAAAIVLLLALAAGAGWWQGQGPGSRVVIPDLSGQETASAEAALAGLSLHAEVIDCPSADVAIGRAVSSEPAAGERVARGSTVRVCRSTGPRLLAVPTLIGLDVDTAGVRIAEAGFTLGAVLEERFGPEARGTVIAALGEDGEGVQAEYPEQARIDLILSAGPVPGLVGSTAEAATAALAAVGLTVDPALGAEAHHAEIPAGQVVRVLAATDPLRAGDRVGLELSLGPELFAIPAVQGMNVNDAAAALRAAGFTVNTGIVPEGPAGGLFEVKGTSPAAGELRQAGTEVSLRFI